MVITLTTAKDHAQDKDRYFLSQGRTIGSANENMYKFLRKEFPCIESNIDVCKADISGLLYEQFSRQWCKGECWMDLFPDFTFVRANRAGIKEISQKMYDKIIEYANAEK